MKIEMPIEEVLKKYKFYCNMTLVVEVDGEEISKRYSVKFNCNPIKIKLPFWAIIWMKVIVLYLRIRYAGTCGEVFCYTEIENERRK